MPLYPRLSVTAAFVFRSAVLLGLLTSSAIAEVQAPRPQFLFGGDYPMAPSDAVRSLFYESGMNCIRITGGGYGWAIQPHKKMADDMQAHGVGVYLQLASHYPSAEFFRYKDAWMVDHAGATGVEDRNAWSISYSGQHWPQLSYVADSYRQEMAETFSKYVGEFALHKNVRGIILHNEPGYFWLNDRIFDYNPATIAKFRAWLSERHKDIATLNQRWGSNFASFEVVEPPHEHPPLKQIGPWMDWRRFHVDAIAGFLKWESEVARKIIPGAPRTTNLAGPIDNWYGYRCGDIAAHSASMDVVGVDIYPTPWTDRAFVPYAVDMARGAAQGRPVHVLECDVFSQKLWKEYSEAQRAELLRSELWTMIGHGANGIFVWGFSRPDQFSLTDGEFNDRVRAARDIAHMARALRLEQFSRSSPNVALCIDPDPFIHATGVEPQPLSNSSSMDSECHGVYAALADAHIRCDVLQAPQLTKEVLAKYRAVVLVQSTMMDQALASRLEQFVSGGGTLFAVGPLARTDRWGNPLPATPGFGLNKVMGIKTATIPSKGFAMTTECGQINPWDVTEQVTPEGAQVLGQSKEGEPGLTRYTYGQGRAYYIVGFPGRAYLASKWGEPFRKFLTVALGSVATPAASSLPANAPVDLSLLGDDRQNMLMVAALHTDKGKLPDEVPQLKVQLNKVQPHVRAVFVFPPTEARDRVVRSGPRKLDIAKSGDRIELDLGALRSAIPVLLARDFGPLLAMAAPAQVKAGQEITVKVTCFNPSSTVVNGRIQLKLPEGLDGPAMRVQIPAFGEQSLQILVKTAPQTAGRSVIGATLRGLSDEAQAIAAPIDVQVQ